MYSFSVCTYHLPRYTITVIALTGIMITSFEFVNERDCMLQ